jgi:recombination protein U
MRNTGKAFEELIEFTNKQYYQKGLAVIQKIPTPWQVERRYNPRKNKTEIKNAYPLEKSTVDFGGTFLGFSVWFDAKTTQNKTSFPLKNLKAHQEEYLQRVHEQQGKAFLIIHSYKENKTWLLWFKDLKRFKKEHERKSIPFNWLNENCTEILASNTFPLDYLKIIEQEASHDINKR